jgi:ESCRT-II complex subunit VPS36
MADHMKISFRAGGEKIFYERLKSAMIQRKWLLQNAPPIPQHSYSSMPEFPHLGTSTHEPPRAVGIAGLERMGLDVRKNNEFLISSAFDDFESLMSSAKEIIAVAESFSKGRAAASG